MINNIEIKQLLGDQVHALSKLLVSAPKDYSKYFIPFSFKEKDLSQIILNAVKDMYFGVYMNDELAGFYMLRGFDEGYKIPSYGVWISDKYSGLGLSKLTLQHAVTLCKSNKINKLMLKVHPENIIAKQIYESFGFKQEGYDKKNSNLIYFKRLD